MPRPLSMSRAVVLVAVVLVSTVAVLMWYLLTGPDKRLARRDVATLSEAVAAFANENGALPRVTVTQVPGTGDDILWGDQFIVESRQLPRADPSRAVGFLVVGTAARWCVEVRYQPSGLFSEFLSDPAPRWVSVKGEVGRAGRAVDGRCGEGGDYLVHLTSVTGTNVPPPGSIVDVAMAPPGTCIGDPSFVGDLIIDDVGATGQAEIIDCSAAHLGEIYHAGELSDSTYAAVWESAAGSCSGAFTSFVGVPRNLSVFGYEAVAVNERQWQAGERGYSCLLFLDTIAYPLVGSAIDSWR